MSPASSGAVRSGNPTPGRRKPPAKRKRRTATAAAPTIALTEEHVRTIAQTKAHSKSLKVIINQRNRLAEMIEWIIVHYADYARRGTVIITNDDRANKNMHFVARSTRDFEYSSLDVNVILAFMSMKKRKIYVEPTTAKAKKRQKALNPEKKNKIMSFETIRMYHDAILFGAEKRKVPLPHKYTVEMKAFLANYKKEHSAAKKDGNVEENESDPFSFSLLRLVCVWFIDTGNIFGWCFILTQWMCMARSINIDCLGWHNLKKGEDSIVVKYDETKADKSGESCSDKNIYANPQDWYVCWYTCLGIYCCFYCTTLSERDSLFIEKNEKTGSAASAFCAALATLLDKFDECVNSYIRVHHANVHGIRKGSGTYASSCSTVPPPLVSIALRGEWSLGKVFDIYFKFGANGDHYLGRILAGLNPHKASFGDLPPHFTADTENKFICDAMLGMFGKLPAIHPVAKSVLLLCLASIVHHSDEIQSYVLAHPGHKLGTLYVFQDTALLTELKALVTQKPTPSMRFSTGVPPHVESMRQIEKLHEKLCEVSTCVKNLSVTIVDTVESAIRLNDVSSGRLTVHALTVSVYVCMHINSTF